MASKLLITIAVLAFAQAVVSLSMRAPDDPILEPQPPPPPPECGANEVYSVCGNLCEDSCNNVCDDPVFQSFAMMNPSTNSECRAGCYCEPGYIRDRDGDCVLITPSVCGTGYNRCGAISKNSVYRKCVSSVPPACFRRNRAMKPAGYRGRCVCRKGYSMNLNRKCVKTNSQACKAESKMSSSIFFMQTTADC